MLIVVSSSSSVRAHSVNWGPIKGPRRAPGCSVFLSISCSFAASFLLFLRRSRKSFRISSSKYCFLPLSLSVGSFARSVGPPPHFPGISHERLRRARVRAAASLLSCNLMRCIFSTARVISPGLPACAIRNAPLKQERRIFLHLHISLACPTSHHILYVSLTHRVSAAHILVPRTTKPSFPAHP